MSRISTAAFFPLFILLLAILPGCGGSGTTGAPPAAGVVRTYYIAAEDVDWNYAPTAINQITGITFADYYNGVADDPDLVTMTRRIAYADPAPDANFTAEPLAVQVGTVYKKTLYVEYTDNTFTVKKPVPAQWRHLGTLGPVIRA